MHFKEFGLFKSKGSNLDSRFRHKCIVDLISITFSLFGHHHLQELRVVDHAIVVIIYLLYQQVHLVVRHGLVLALQALLQLVGADGS